MANACSCRETASLREIADVVEQLFTIAATCVLRNVTPESGGGHPGLQDLSVVSPQRECASCCARAPRKCVRLTSSAGRQPADRIRVVTRCQR
jgi:hypothetical protein